MGDYKGKGIAYGNQRDSVVPSGQYVNHFNNVIGQRASASSGVTPTQTPVGKVSSFSIKEGENVNDVVTATFSIYTRPVKALFDSGASHSYISTTKVGKLELGSLNPLLILLLCLLVRFIIVFLSIGMFL